MTSKIKTLLFIGVSAVAVSACGDSDGMDDTPTPTPAPSPAAFEDQFGDNFGMAFRMDANGDPIDPMDGDIIPVTLKEDPINVPDPSDDTD